MRSLSDATLRDLLPPTMRNDADAIAASNAIAEDCERMFRLATSVVVFAGIDHLSEAWLDELAGDMHVDFYDRTLSIKQKRELVQQSIEMHRKKGTPWAVEQLITIVFGEGRVEEWFEYGGKPYHFKVYSSNHLATPEDVRRFFVALDSVKNLRSILDEVLILRTWGEVLEKDYLTWGQLLGEHTWGEHLAGTWNDLKGRPWLEALCMNSWGNVYNYVWEGLL